MIVLGDREANADLRTWIDRFGTLGHSENSYDHWVSIGKPRNAARIDLAFALLRLDRTSAEELDEKRQRLISFIWKVAGYPAAKTPYSVTKDITDSRYADLTNLAGIDRIDVQMEFGVNSIIYLFHPRNSNGRLLVYHQGHDGDFFLGINTIQFFLQHGYAVAAFAMPLLGMNSQPAIQTSEGSVTLWGHGHLPALESDIFSPLKFFVEPIMVFLNYAIGEYRYDMVAMVGISGGGWTTALYAALDPRIAPQLSSGRYVATLHSSQSTL